MLEHIVQMGPMLVLSGLIAGWVAEAASRAGGYGFVFDLVLGCIGSVVGGAIVWALISSDLGFAWPTAAQACSSYERLAPSLTHSFALKLYW